MQSSKRLAGATSLGARLERVGGGGVEGAADDAAVLARIVGIGRAAAARVEGLLAPVDVVRGPRPRGLRLEQGREPEVPVDPAVRIGLRFRVADGVPELVCVVAGRAGLLHVLVADLGDREVLELEDLRELVVAVPARERGVLDRAVLEARVEGLEGTPPLAGVEGVVLGPGTLVV